RIVYLVGQTDGRVRHIYVLATSPARAIGINTQACWINVHFDRLIHFWSDQHCCKRRMPSFCRIERGNTYQTMHTMLGLEIAICIASCDLEGGAFDTRFFARLEIEHFVPTPVRLGPPDVHTQQHVRPVL